MSFTQKGFDPPSNQVASGPAALGTNITPSDTDDLPFTTRQIHVGGAGSGNLAVLMAGCVETVQFTGLTANQLLDICVTRVLDTGTDVTGIVALA